MIAGPVPPPPAITEAGDTQFMAASPNGRRSATVSINTRLVPTFGDPDANRALRRTEVLAVCAALAGK